MKALNILLFLILVFQLLGQKPTVSLTADIKTVQVGEQITFTVKSTIAGGVTIDFPKEFIAGNGTMNGMEQEMDYNMGEVTTIYYFSQNGSFKSNGTYTFYAFVNNRKKIFKSNALTIKVEKQTAVNPSMEEEISKRILKQPIFGLIQRSKTKVYEGEPVVLEAKIYSKLNINMLEEYAPFEVDGGAEMKEIEKSQRLLMSKVALKGQNYLSFTYGKQVVFPSQIGKVKIKPFEMMLQYDNGSIFSEQISFVSNPSVIEVVPLPDGAPKDFIGGVGTFELTSQLNKKSGKVGDIVALKITVSGVGNLHHVAKPKVQLPKQLSVYGDPEIDEQISFSAKGAEGNITYTYHLRLEKEGKTVIPIASISYFNPEKKKYIQVKNTIHTLEILPSQQTLTTSIVSQISPKMEEKHAENIPLFVSASVQNDGNFYQSIYFWPSVVSPFLLAFLGGVCYNPKKQKSVKKTDNDQIRKIILNKTALITQLALNKTENTQQRVRELENILKSLTQENTDTTNPFCTKLELYDFLKNYGVSEVKLDELKQLFVACEEIKYAFDDQTAKLNQVIERAQTFLNDLV